MASPSWREAHRSTLAPQFPHFFKVILDKTHLPENLMIPKRFVRLYGDTLSDSVLLKVPNGKIWQIDITRHENGEFWLENIGWKSFAKYYSLRYGYLLAFRYNGNSSFFVIIFDMSATEIDYEINGKALKTPKIEVGDEDDAIENVDGFSLQTRSHKCKRANSTSDQSQLASQSNGMKLELTTKGFSGEGMFVSGAFQRAGSFKTENPSFVLVMHPSYVNKWFQVTIPIEFARRHFKHGDGDAILFNSDGRSWLVKYKFGEQSAKKRARIYCGWEAFVKDNGLEVGNVCVFELKNGAKVSFRVVIFRESDKANNSPLQEIAYEA